MVEVGRDRVMRRVGSSLDDSSEEHSGPGKKLTWKSRGLGGGTQMNGASMGSDQEITAGRKGTEDRPLSAQWRPAASGSSIRRESLGRLGGSMRITNAAPMVDSDEPRQRNDDKNFGIQGVSAVHDGLPRRTYVAVKDAPDDGMFGRSYMKQINALLHKEGVQNNSSGCPRSNYSDYVPESPRESQYNSGDNPQLQRFSKSLGSSNVKVSAASGLQRYSGNWRHAEEDFQPVESLRRAQSGPHSLCSSQSSCSSASRLLEGEVLGEEIDSDSQHSRGYHEVDEIITPVREVHGARRATQMQAKETKVFKRGDVRKHHAADYHESADNRRVRTSISIDSAVDKPTSTSSHCGSTREKRYSNSSLCESDERNSSLASRYGNDDHRRSVESYHEITDDLRFSTSSRRAPTSKSNESRDDRSFPASVRNETVDQRRSSAVKRNGGTDDRRSFGVSHSESSDDKLFSTSNRDNSYENVRSSICSSYDGASSSYENSDDAQLSTFNRHEGRTGISSRSGEEAGASYHNKLQGDRGISVTRSAAARDSRRAPSQSLDDVCEPAREMAAAITTGDYGIRGAQISNGRMSTAEKGVSDSVYRSSETGTLIGKLLAQKGRSGQTPSRTPTTPTRASPAGGSNVNTEVAIPEAGTQRRRRSSLQYCGNESGSTLSEPNTESASEVSAEVRLSSANGAQHYASEITREDRNSDSDCERRCTVARNYGSEIPENQLTDPAKLTGDEMGRSSSQEINYEVLKTTALPSSRDNSVGREGNDSPPLLFVGSNSEDEWADTDNTAVYRSKASKNYASEIEEVDDRNMIYDHLPQPPIRRTASFNSLGRTSSNSSVSSSDKQTAKARSSGSSTTTTKAKPRSSSPAAQFQRWISKQFQLGPRTSKTPERSRKGSVPKTRSSPAKARISSDPTMKNGSGLLYEVSFDSGLKRSGSLARSASPSQARPHSPSKFRDLLSSAIPGLSMSRTSKPFERNQFLCLEMNELNKFLKEQRHNIQNVHLKRQSSASFRVISSGPSEGLGSLVAAICYSWLLQKRASNGSWHAVPVINFPRRQMCNHLDTAWLFDVCGLDVQSLLFLDEVNFQEMVNAGSKIRMCVIGENELRATDLQVGSCCTLLAEMYVEEAHNLLQAQFIKTLLAAGLLADTVNLDKRRSGDRDRHVYPLLQAGAGPLGRTAFFNQMKYASRDPSVAALAQKEYVDCVSYGSAVPPKIDLPAVPSESGSGYFTSDREGSFASSTNSASSASSEENFFHTVSGSENQPNQENTAFRSDGKRVEHHNSVRDKYLNYAASMVLRNPEVGIGYIPYSGT